jgi:site-specific recombinase XerD|tara:strand:- start:317 stop:1174 length:858 start_codon:yes stop_codon:yes gene_type:complete
VIENFCGTAPSLFGLADNTVKTYRNSLKLYEKWYQNPVEQTKPIDVMNYMAYLKKTGRTRSTLTVRVSALRIFFDWLIMQNLAQSNPTAGIRQRGGRAARRLPKNLTRQELKTLLSAPQAHYDPLIRERDQMLIAFLASTGLRVSEALSVTPNDFDWPNKSLTIIGKGNKQAVVFITRLVHKNFASRMEKYVKNSGVPGVLPLFDISVREAQRVVKKWGRKAKIKQVVTPHVLRHTFGTLLATEVGLGLEELKEAMRHTSITTTQIYVHTTSVDLQRNLAKAGVL